MKDWHDLPDDELRKRMSNFSEEPDESVWGNIRAQFELQNNLQHRLKQYHETPDESTWRFINRELRQKAIIKRFEQAGQVAAVIALLMLIFPLTWQNTNQLKKDDAVSSPRQASADPDDSTTSKQPRRDETSTTTFADSLAVVNALPDISAKTTSVHHQEPAITNRDGNAQRELMSSPQKNTSIIDITEASNSRDTLIVLPEVLPSTTHEQARAATQITKLDSLPPDTVARQPELVTTKRKQQDKRTGASKRKGIYFLAMPTLGYQHIKPKSGDNIIVESIDKLSAFSPKRLGIRAELGMSWDVGAKLRVHAGAVYLHRKQEVAYSYLVEDEFELVEAGVLQYELEPREQNARYAYTVNNLGLLVGMNYILKEDKLVHRLGGAIEYHYAINGFGTAPQQTYLFGDVYYLISYPISTRFDIAVQPTLNYALQLDKRVNAPFDVKPYGLGINFGLYFRLQ